MDGRPGAYMTDHLTEKAVEFLETSRNKPFLLYLSHYAVHTPVEGKEELVAKYRNKERGPQQNPVYAAMVESVDRSAGAVLGKLDELKLAGNTVVIFTSDNGGLTSNEGPNTPPTTNAPLRDGKKHLWEGGIRVPLIVRWPGAARAGAVTDYPAISNDFFPTLLEIAGVPASPADGVSLVPVLRGKGRPRREALYWHVPHYNRPGAAIRRGDYKLIEFYDPPGVEMYNLKKDIGESQNLVDAEPATAAELKDALHAWQKSVGAKMMEPNPDFRQ
jgi:arylsulfatase A-like enzyme